MIAKTTSGISIVVMPKYNDKLSFIDDNYFVFEYFITIENIHHDFVRLLFRKWYIFDSLKEPCVVQGMGVIGENPMLKRGEKYSYTSFCELKSEIGYMEGIYTFLNLETNKQFKVSIPRFELVYPFKLN